MATTAALAVRSASGAIRAVRAAPVPIGTCWLGRATQATATVARAGGAACPAWSRPCHLTGTRPEERLFESNGVTPSSPHHRRSQRKSA